MSTAASQNVPRPRATIVVVDDEENMGKILTKILGNEGFHVTAFHRPAEAMAHITKHPPDLVLTDMKMPDHTGMDVLKAAKGANPHTGVVVMTAYGTIEGGVEAMREGAYDYVTKPFKTDELVMTLVKALERSHMGRENESLAETLRRTSDAPPIVGESTAMKAVAAMVAKIAPTDAAVLIRGESGTGKELVAKAIHKASPRAGKRFVAINCASIPETLLESELFGHERGSFTGADRQKLGLVELAHEGTLFLDEIGDLPLSLQAKLLRVLQEREIQRVGGVQTIPVDIRLLAATHRDLRAAMEARQFRPDLFFRLDVISVALPPLRERTGDVPLLASFFLDQATRRMRKPAMTIAPEAMAALEKYGYPGNVRELENIIERMAVLCDGAEITLADIPGDIRVKSGVKFPAVGSQGAEYKGAKDKFEREYFLRLLDAAKGNISEAARMSGVSRRHLHEKLVKLGLRADRESSL
ncbi:MAG: sigma-54 dependent transcriptional regulator [Candidatus Sumerlaeaceae bacterium]|nr:sigma-54 dependent transcriptional regulator [Candidatus Sumerlaeaceae bacterium]